MNTTRFCLLFLFALSLPADVRLPAILSDHALLQRGAPVRIWGKADPGEQVSVKFRGQSLSAAANPLGTWSVFLAPMEAGGPFELTVQGRNTITVRDVLVGEVWVASGQSNMVWPVKLSDNAAQEIASAKYPQIRLFKVANKVSDVPLDDVSAVWELCSPDTVPAFSGAGYFFARHLHQRLNVPVGVIQSAWGGTPAESWTSLPALAADPGLISVFSDWARLLADYPENLARQQAAMKANPDKKLGPPPGPGHQWTPGGLYNAMIAPLTPYAIRGAIWYQGENNAGKRRSYVYRRLFRAMIEDWRRAWGQGDFPFLFVQLANYAKTGENSQWPELREAQTMALGLRNAGMAVSIDIGNPEDIHPRNKQDVGLRLALAARAIAYSETLEFSGPMFREARAEAGSVRVWFDHAGGGLKARGSELRGFEIAGRDLKFVPAAARIDGASVVVSGSGVEAPQHVRYGWADSPDCNLYNGENLPASPFRSYEWADATMHRQ